MSDDAWSPLAAEWRVLAPDGLEAVLAELHDVLVGVAAPFRTQEGGFRLLNRFRWAVARA